MTLVGARGAESQDFSMSINERTNAHMYHTPTKNQNSVDIIGKSTLSMLDDQSAAGTPEQINGPEPPMSPKSNKDKVQSNY